MNRMTAEPAPIIISGTTGELNERRYSQFWGPYKVAGRERDECLASMSTGGGLSIDPQCPEGWLAAIWDAFTLIRAGGIPEATHTAGWTFGRPVFTAIVPADDQQAFDFSSLAVPSSTGGTE